MFVLVASLVAHVVADELHPSSLFGLFLASESEQDYGCKTWLRTWTLVPAWILHLVTLPDSSWPGYDTCLPDSGRATCTLSVFPLSVGSSAVLARSHAVCTCGFGNLLIFVFVCSLFKPHAHAGPSLSFPHQVGK